MKETDKMEPPKGLKKRKKNTFLKFYGRVKKAVSKDQTLIDF
ncbi:hypothetical protein [Flavobacterium hibernum]|nr:hypothetical protein [Flavobacterium hibernum]STO10660.1 Uncharacterised protein [Flavobacterium hibernum]